MPFLDYPLETLRAYRAEDPEPDDFDRFWGATIEEVGQGPIDGCFERRDLVLYPN